jgi:hypothetical protein
VPAEQEGVIEVHTMTDKKTLFRRVYDAIIEGRSAQAQRRIQQYLRAADAGPQARTE